MAYQPQVQPRSGSRRLLGRGTALLVQAGLLAALLAALATPVAAADERTRGRENPTRRDFGSPHRPPAGVSKPTVAPPRGPSAVARPAPSNVTIVPSRPVVAAPQRSIASPAVVPPQRSIASPAIASPAARPMNPVAQTRRTFDPEGPTHPNGAPIWTPRSGSARSTFDPEGPTRPNGAPIRPARPSTPRPSDAEGPTHPNGAPILPGRTLSTTPRPPAIVVPPPAMPPAVVDGRSDWRRAPPHDRGAVFDGHRPPGGVVVMPGVRPNVRPDHGGGYRLPAHPRVLPALPPAHRVIPYRGTPYYFSGNLWYRPVPSGFALAMPPIGFVTPVLPSYYSRLAAGGIVYYVADGVYYRHSPQGYVVVEPPALASGGFEVPGMPRLYVYPRNGQSAEQLASDRYECHVWAIGETGFDPTVSGGGIDPSQLAAGQAEYRRALEACLDARGYTVR